MDRADALGRFAAAPIARMATVRPDGQPHLVPVTFVLVDDLVVTAIDHKPKSTQQLARLRNLESTPRATFLVDHYEDDWSRLWWVRVDTATEVLPTANPWLDALAAKYLQYRDHPPQGPAIAGRIGAVRSWEASPDRG